MMKHILLPYDALEEYKKLTDEQFGRLIRAVLRYAQDEEEVDLDGPESYLLPGLKLKIARAKEKYQRKCEQNTDNINKRWNNRNVGNGSGTKSDESYHIPTRVEVEEYIKANHLDVDPDDFMDHYSSRHWTVDGSPDSAIVDWKPLARRWSRNNRKKNTDNESQDTETKVCKLKWPDDSSKVTPGECYSVTDFENAWHAEMMRQNKKIRLVE